MSSPTKMLLHGPFPPIKKLKVKDLREEVEMWRNIWSWIPSEVKYYVARTGQEIALTMRNYQRHMGVLLATYWDLREIELGVYAKEYDVRDGQYYYERKIVRTKLGGTIDVQWIAERKSETQTVAESAQEMDQEELDEALE